MAGPGTGLAHVAVPGKPLREPMFGPCLRSTPLACNGTAALRTENGDRARDTAGMHPAAPCCYRGREISTLARASGSAPQGPPSGSSVQSTQDCCPSDGTASWAPVHRGGSGRPKQTPCKGWLRQSRSERDSVRTRPQVPNRFRWGSNRCVVKLPFTRFLFRILNRDPPAVRVGLSGQFGTNAASPPVSAT